MRPNFKAAKQLIKEEGFKSAQEAREFFEVMMIDQVWDSSDVALRDALCALEAKGK